MKTGTITVDGHPVGTIEFSLSFAPSHTFPRDLDGYVPEGRAAEPPLGAPAGPVHRGHGEPHFGPYSHRQHDHRAAPARRARFGGEGDTDPPVQHRDRPGYTPRGETYSADRGHPVQSGTANTDQAIVDAARAHHLDPNTMRSIASIESSMNPASNANNSHKYKGLYQIGPEEWRRFGGDGNIYSARDNAMATGRMFSANRAQFRERYGRDPTDSELYMMHQQGLGFYTRGAMTNIGGNPYPGMRGAQSHESFESGWGREVARRKEQFAARHGERAEAKPEKAPAEKLAAGEAAP
ncbi:hypothetical protein ABIF64_000454 [Bradyrhizobium japonicum]|uniref:hypothetical protein n=1 Tax=Bradyrhizobium japonicum TaxID=375 RepID=UPI0033947FF9